MGVIAIQLILLVLILVLCGICAACCAIIVARQGLPPTLKRPRSPGGIVTLPFEYNQSDVESADWEQTIDKRVASLEQAIEYNRAYERTEPQDEDDLSTYRRI